jgi:hypothetical protein
MFTVFRPQGRTEDALSLTTASIFVYNCMKGALSLITAGVSCFLISQGRTENALSLTTACVYVFVAAQNMH